MGDGAGWLLSFAIDSTIVLIIRQYRSSVLWLWFMMVVSSSSPRPVRCCCCCCCCCFCCPSVIVKRMRECDEIRVISLSRNICRHFWFWTEIGIHRRGSSVWFVKLINCTGSYFVLKIMCMKNRHISIHDSSDWKPAGGVNASIFLQTHTLNFGTRMCAQHATKARKPPVVNHFLLWMVHLNFELRIANASLIIVPYTLLGGSNHK